MRKILFYLILISCSIAFLFQPAWSWDENWIGEPQESPGWKEKQQALFEKYDIKEGDVLDSSNCGKIKSLLPESVFNWVKKGEFTIPIGAAKYDYGTDMRWKSNGYNNGRYKLGDQNQIIEKSTGIYPEVMWGIPFPLDEIDFTDTKNAAPKIMHDAYSFAAAGTPLIIDFAME